MKEFFKNKYVLYAIAALVVAIVVYLIYYWGKKEAGVTIASDTGSGPTAADIAKAEALANRLKDDLEGVSLGHDDSIYLELAGTSNVVFALTFVRYKAIAQSSLLADIQADYFYGWDVVDVIVNRATALNLS